MIMEIEIIQMASEVFGGIPRQHLSCTPIEKGASGRGIFRVSSPDGQSVIAISHDGDKEENQDFVQIARWLGENGVPVPKILAVQENQCLIEDLGALDLMGLHQQETWPVSRAVYHSALDGLKTLQSLSPQPPFDLPRQFDYATYRWEQDYFFEHLWRTHLGRSEQPDRAALDQIAMDLAASQPCLVHRDFQSQNLMVTSAGTKFIDFQGVRPGHAEYDLASLMFDPYTRLTEEQRSELLDYWISIGGTFDQTRFEKCALQRLMQALGAFANIYHNFNNDWYLQHISPASENLEMVLEKLGLASLELHAVS